VIISHRHRLIFIRAPKTAGSSIEAFLTPRLGYSDILIGGPLHISEPWNSELSMRRGLRMLSALLGDIIMSEHDDPADVRDFIQRILELADSWQDVWKRYHKWAVVRNPWDLAVSYYWHCRKNEHEAAGDQDKPLLSSAIEDFRDWLHCETRQYCQWFHDHERMYFDENGAPVLDQYLRFEALATEMAALCEGLGIVYEPLPRLRSDIRLLRDPYPVYYNVESQDLVAKIHRNTIRTFGYDF